jgi:hypothetical protein
MNLRHGTLRLLVNAAVFVCLPICVWGQDKWERVHTGQEYIIEINVNHLKLEPERVLQAQFRTILSQKQNTRRVSKRLTSSQASESIGLQR